MFVIDDDLKEKFLSNLKVEKEPKTDVEDLVKLVEPEPLVQPHTMKCYLLRQQLIFERDIVAIQKWELPEGSAEALLNPNFLLTKDPVVEEISSLLALASEHASDGYCLLSEAESFL